MPIRVRWEGPFFTNQSLAVVNRELAVRVGNSVGVDLSLLPSDDAITGAWDSSGVEKLTPLLNRPHQGADICVRHQWPANLHAPQGQYWVMMQPWEYGALPRLWYDPMKFGADEIWVYSSFNKQCYVEAGIDADRIRVIPLGVSEAMLLADPVVRLPSTGPFRFLFVGGTILRKGIDLLLEAYTSTFSAADDVVLVVKDFGVGSYYRNQTHESFIRELQAQPSAPKIEYIPDDLPVESLRDLYHSCDCLVHPYRGEGFGLPIAEAMACGLPVIVPEEGGASDFCTPETAVLIPTMRKRMPASLARPLETIGHSWWMEPDVKVLGQRMREVFESPKGFNGIASRGREKIRAGFTWVHAADAVVTGLGGIEAPGGPIASNPTIRHQLRMTEGVERWERGDRLGALRNFVQAAEHQRGADTLFNIGSALLSQREFHTALEIFTNLQDTSADQSPELMAELNEVIAACKDAISNRSVISREQPSVRWCAPIFNASGYASESRSFLSGLTQSGSRWRIQLVPHEKVQNNALVDPGTFSRLEAMTREVIRNPDIDFQHGPASAFTPPRAEISVCRTMFETDRIPSEWADSCNRFTQVWVPSAFNRQSFIASGVVPEKIKVIPGSIQAAAYDPDLYLGARTVANCGFCFFSVFDFTPRKGWDLLLRAYFEEFQPNEDVCLVVKVTNFFGRNITPDQRIRRFMEDNGYASTPRIIVIEQSCSDSELRRLYAGSDAFVLASRGEGWGRPYMEAMALGLPTIGTRWSANTEFMNDENSFLVEIEGLEACERTWSEMPLYNGQLWAIPSIESLRQRMREVFTNRAEGQSRGARARVDVLTNYDEAVVAERFSGELERLLSSYRMPILNTRNDNRVQQSSTSRQMAVEPG
ncbi:MAG TPA: glycosyltransferase family 4 protein [Longimicrobiaceae bacterium]|nr:glycosyltransferase family 4 protein [Longimicrobiaceae bacterium]